MKKYLSVFMIVMLFSIGIAGCAKNTESESDGRLNVVATTTMLADAVKIIGGDRINVQGLMGPGIDPHLYKASAGDVNKMQNAQIIIYNGIHLEGKMAEIFENMERQNKVTKAVAESIAEEKLLETDSGYGSYDPHVWFNVGLWIEVVKEIEDTLSEQDPENADFYQKNADSYVAELEELDKYIDQRVEEVPKDKRVLVTAHDAFGYFGDRYGFEVRGLQGLSTATEAGTADVKNLADYIAENQIPAMFVESSVPPKNIEALKDAVASRGFEVEIGGELFSDSLGNPESEVGTYTGTVKHNIDTIVNALKK